MGRKGPAPTPTAHLAARGSKLANRNPNEPEPQPGAPERPHGLSAAAGKVWGAVCSLVGAGVLTRDNGQSLGRYCTDLVRWWKLAAWLETNDEVYKTVDQLGNVRWARHPNVITYEKLGASLLRLEQEFGLTPSARTRVHAIANEVKKAPPAPAGPPKMRLAQ